MPDPLSRQELGICPNRISFPHSTQIVTMSFSIIAYPWHFTATLLPPPGKALEAHYRFESQLLYPAHNPYNASVHNPILHTLKQKMTSPGSGLCLTTIQIYTTLKPQIVLTEHHITTNMGKLIWQFYYNTDGSITHKSLSIITTCSSLRYS